MSTALAGLETLQFEFLGTTSAGVFAPILVGVVGSGNLEILLEPGSAPSCRIEVQTSTRGFGAIWEAVLRDFHEGHRFAGLRISIHDMGATPAVVSLRLEQAAAELPGAYP